MDRPPREDEPSTRAGSATGAGRTTSRYVGLGLLLVGLLVGLGLLAALLRASRADVAHVGPPERLVLAAETVPHASAVWVAEHQGYYRDEGVEVQVREFESGRTALFTMLDSGGIDIATAAQTPVVSKSFGRADYAIVANMVSSDSDIKLLARRDRSIWSPADLRGKTVGITSGSSGHFFLELFLAYHDLRFTDIKILDLEPARLGAALVRGEADAVATWEPHIYEARKALAEKAVLLPSEGMYREDFYFIARKEFIASHPQALVRFLRASDRASRFIAAHPALAMAIVVRRLNMDREILTATWSDFRFGLSLDQSVLLGLEDEARWAMENRQTAATRMPNYLDYLHTDALLAVNPEAVTVAGRGREP